MTAVRNVYRVIRSVLFTIVITVVAFFVFIYIALSVPAVHTQIRKIAERELTAFLKAPVHIGKVTIRPVNELILDSVEIRTPEGGKCIDVGRIGAGIGFWRLVSGNGVEITYAELIGLNATIEQKEKDGPFNIKFLIDAFRPKRKNQPPARFDVKLHNVTIRKSAISFARLWIPEQDSSVFDPNHIRVTNLRADVAMPRLSNDDYEVNLHRVSFREQSGMYVDALSCLISATPELISVKNLKLDLTNTKIRLNDFALPINGFKDIMPALKNSGYNIHLTVSDIVPSDFSFLNPKLDLIGGRYFLSLEASGHPENISVDKMSFSDSEGNIGIEMTGDVQGFPDVRSMQGRVGRLSVDCDMLYAKQVISEFVQMPELVSAIMSRAGFLRLRTEGLFSLSSQRAGMTTEIEIAQGNLNVGGKFGWAGGTLAADIKAQTDGMQVGELLADGHIGSVAVSIDGSVAVRGKNFDALNGNAAVNVASMVVNGYELDNLMAEVSKENRLLDVRLYADCPYLDGELTATGLMDGENSSLNLNGSLHEVDGAVLGMKGKWRGVYGVENIYAQLHGNKPDNINGEARVSGVRCDRAADSDWELSNLGVVINADGNYRRINVDSDVVDGELRGQFRYAELPRLVAGLLANALPSYIKAPETPLSDRNTLTYSVTVKNNDNLYKTFGLPVQPVAPVRVYGDADNDRMNVTLVAPYIVKGNKLIKNINLIANAGRYTGLKLHGVMDFPMKNQYLSIGIDADAFADRISSSLDWATENKINNGKLRLGMDISRDELLRPTYTFRMQDSDVMINGEQWDIRPMEAVLSDKVLTVDNLHLSHGKQFITVSGRASASANDTITAQLNDIDLSYIFNTLNIKYVTFGGHVTGKAIGTQLFTSNPVATTQGLHARNFSYNGAPVGDADLLGYYDSQAKAVGIVADISGGTPDVRTKVDGRIYVGADSLRINFDAHKINLALIQPFLDNILEKVEGQGTATLSLFGTFKNISLTGKAFADTAAVKLGFTGVTYHGSDSVYFDTDGIRIPGFRVYDRYGHSALFGGDVKMKYFRDATVNFFVRDIRNLLCYDLGQGTNPIWWGRIFGSGSGNITGRPGFTRISFNVRTNPNSNFTFALDETQTASEYDFLTFVDTSKKRVTEILSVEEQLENRYKKAIDDDEDESGDFELDLAVTLNPGIKMNVIMDPSAGDKITATGNGAMRLNYNTFSDRMEMFGKYVLNDGNYRFSFQDIILRDFKIRSGSTISFNGDPMLGTLDLTAGYRVNTNLTDLDKSFAGDRDLNRSSVPVEALIKVSGILEHPEIGYDLSLPTVTSDVERKVRSIISSDEMMQQQVLYLLALNRFYTPQYTGNTDGELMSVASSTISSQISNIMSQMTDKISLNPSFKSDRSDLSDMEVDLALSSQLFDNRLIINGNLGYRDKSVSQSTFIGDFDLEYLLSKNGRFRLKAYNHFNDAYYYLKSALTTQGVGLIYRTDFDNPFKFLKRKKKKNDPKGKEREVSGVIKDEKE